MISEMELDEVALADADEKARHFAAERPKQIVHTIGHAFHDFAHFEIHDDFRRVFALDRRGHIRSHGEDGFLLADDLGIGALCSRSGQRGGGSGGRLGREEGSDRGKADGRGEDGGRGECAFHGGKFILSHRSGFDTGQVST
jgi:hypothetical protein